ncbi:DUF4194 domain-containing protein [Parashewanella spongiae]|uniref:DUF4194 domain-containing protein n=1 Tax=Parashewanella spongiae TaxID=342950 RepID=A0A3A6TBW6_9GAMM|nr:DUF4194 domain-containing protein [Parashewanella spongiae]MCL1078752.1 DUF4194 domain-containing protein [Parashewanella spongiae]RJY12504.1 DUF4194 domain-containing protein [Parashewanella spongiae]
MQSEENNFNAQLETLHKTLKIRLLKGPVFRENQRQEWEVLERDQTLLRTYFSQIGLSLRIDDVEGYAFLKQEDKEDDNTPSLIVRRSLTFHQSLLLVMIRKRLAEHDSEESAPRLFVHRQEIHQWLQPYFSDAANEIKQIKQFDTLIKKVSEWGFLKALPQHSDEFEIKRIIKAFVTAEDIASFTLLLEQRLKTEENEENHDQ